MNPGEPERIARFVVDRSWIRGDGTVRGPAFSPYPHRCLSVSQTRDRLDSEVWDAGARVAAARSRTLVGRADLPTFRLPAAGLRLVPSPTPMDPGHADVVDWPPEKPEQMELARELASHATFLASPRGG